MSHQQLFPLGSFARDQIIKFSLIWASIFTGLTLLLALYCYRLLPPFVPLFFSLVKGENQLAPRSFILVLPVSAFAFFIAHLFLAQTNFISDRMFSRILSATST